MFSKVTSIFQKKPAANVAVAEKPAATPTVDPTPKTSAAPTTFTAPVPTEKSLAAKYRDGLATGTEIWSNGDSVEDKDLVIRAAYKQVFGNAHIMDSERAVKAESMYRFGQISVRDFILELALSDRYQTLFWEKYPTSTFIELNFKHFLGRAPYNQAEIQAHTKILREGGFRAEIESYLNSDEYYTNFGGNIVPYFRGYNSQVGQAVVGYTHAYPLANLACTSDKSVLNSGMPRVNMSLLTGAASEIPEVRAIPDSYPADFLPPSRPPRYSSEMIVMAREILKNKKSNVATLPGPADSEIFALYAKAN